MKKVWEETEQALLLDQSILSPQPTPLSHRGFKKTRKFPSPISPRSEVALSANLSPPSSYNNIVAYIIGGWAKTESDEFLCFLDR